MSEQPEPISVESKSPRRFRPALIGGLFLLGLVILGLWYVLQSAARKAESAAGAKIKALGALAVMDANREYVASLNTMTIKDSEKFNEVMSLTPALKRLQILNLSKASVTSEQLAAFSGLTRLTTLQLNDTATKDSDIQHFRKMAVLESLYVANTNITEAAVDEIAKLKSLTVLDISRNELKDLSPLASIPKLSWLVFQKDAPLSDETLESIGKISSLRRLSINPQFFSETQRDRLTDINSQLSIDK